MPFHVGNIFLKPISSSDLKSWLTLEMENLEARLYLDIMFKGLPNYKNWIRWFNWKIYCPLDAIIEETKSCIKRLNGKGNQKIQNLTHFSWDLSEKEFVNWAKYFTLGIDEKGGIFISDRLNLKRTEHQLDLSKDNSRRKEYIN